MRYCLLVFLAFCVVGCSTMHKVVSYAQSNPVIVDIATRQALARYVGAGASDAEKRLRASQVESTIKEVEYFLEGNPTASSKTLLLVLRSHVDFDVLDVSDRLLVDDILTTVERSLATNEQAGMLNENAVIRIRVLLRTLLQTAAMFK